MKRKVYVSLLAAPLLFAIMSCSPAYEWEANYQAGKWEEVIAEADRVLEDKIDSTALHYKALSHYNLKENDEAASAALLYYAMNSKTPDERLHDNLRVILYCHDSAVVRAWAGETLIESGLATTGDNVSLFSVYMEMGDYVAAADLYNAIRPGLSDRTAAMMCINARASSSLIVTNLEAWLSSQGESAELETAVATSAAILLQRDEGYLILDLCDRLYDEGDNSLAIAIGDIHLQMGYPQAARRWYSSAYEEYPQVVMERLELL